MSDDEDDDIDDIDDSDEDEDSEEEGQAVGPAAGGGVKRSFVAQLREELQKAPFDQELHAALISAHREAADLERLQAARRQAAARVALPEAAWLEWLQDEARLADEADFEELDALHAQACSMCPTSRTWLARCALHRGRATPSGGGPEAARAVYEEALGVLGLHPAEGAEVWAEFRDFEEGLMASAATPQERARQAQRVRALFMRQLALPLPGAARLRDAHATFEGGLEGECKSKMALAKAEAVASAAAKEWERRSALEQRFAEASRPAMMVGPAESTPASPAEVSAELLALEEGLGDAARVALAHLRATQCSPRDPDRWQRFVDFAVGTQRDHRKAAEVLERAVRHCSAHSAFWPQLHREREAAAGSLAQLKDVVERAMAAMQHAPPRDRGEEGAEGPEHGLLCQHADACRRAASAPPTGASGDAAFAEMRASLERALGVAHVPGPTLLRWMRLEAYGAGSAQHALEVGKRLAKCWGPYYNVWSSMIAAVQYCTRDGAYETVRSLYMDALAQVADYPDQVQSDYVQFERECGTLQSWLEACGALEQRQKAAAAAASGAGPPEATGGASTEAQPEEAQPTPRPAGHKRGAAKAKAAQAKKKQRGSAATEVAAAATQDDGAMKALAMAEPAAAAQAQEAPTRTEPRAPSKVDVAPAAAAGSSPEAGHVLPAATGKSAAHAAPSEAEGAVVGTGKSGTPAAAAAAAAAAAPAEAALPGNGATAEAPAVGRAAAPAEAPAAPEAPSAVDAAAAEAPAAKAEAAKAPAAVDAAAAEGPAAKADAAKNPAAVDAAAAEGPAANAEAAADSAPHQGSHYHQRRLAQGADAPTKPEAEGKQTVYVSNLDWSVDEAHLYRIFGDIDGLKDVRLVRDFLKRSKGYAYIDFEQSKNVEEAVQKLDGHMVNKRPMRVARSLPTKPLFEERTLFVKSISKGATEADVKDVFARQGEVIGVRMPTDPTTKAHKGYAYVEFATAESLEAALKAEAPKVGDQAVLVSRSIPMKDHRHQTAGNRKDLPQRSNQRVMLEQKLQREDPARQSAKCPTTVYVKDLAFKTDDAALRSHFAECGEVVQTMVVRNAQGRSRGFGFVEFKDPSGAQGALLLSDSELHGRKIVVSRSQREITQKKAPAAEAAAQEESRKEAHPARGPQPKAGAKRRLVLGEANAAAAAPAAAEPAEKKSKVPFRSVRSAADEKEAGAGEDKAGEEKPDGQAPAPMTNADFRKLLLGGR